MFNKIAENSINTFLVIKLVLIFQKMKNVIKKYKNKNHLWWRVLLTKVHFLLTKITTKKNYKLPKNQKILTKKIMLSSNLNIIHTQVKKVIRQKQNQKRKKVK